MGLLQEFANGDTVFVPVDPANVHYPEHGAEILAEMEEDHFWFVIRRKLILNLLRRFVKAPDSKTPVNGLDIGCGTGFNAVFLTEQGLPTYGIDAYQGFSKFQKAKRGMGFIQGDIFKIEPKPEFDFVLLLDVIEHIEGDDRFLKRSFEFLKPNGVVIITAPAFKFLWSTNDDYSGHLRRYTKGSLMKLLEQTHIPIKIEKMYYFYGALLPFYMLSRFLSKFSPQSGAAEIKPSPLLNLVFKLLLKAETVFQPFNGMPMGSSVFACIRKC